MIDESMQKACDSLIFLNKIIVQWQNQLLLVRLLFHLVRHYSQTCYCGQFDKKPPA